MGAEIAYDPSSSKYVIYWSTSTSTNSNKAIYYCTTSDFNTLSSAAVLYNDNGNTTIDADIVYNGTQYVMFAKDERTGYKNIYSTTSTSLTGPYSSTTNTVSLVSAQDQEGPSAIKIGGNWIVYTDHFSNSTYGAQISTDNMSTWTDYTMSVSFPSHTRHGDVLTVPLSVVSNLIDDAANATEEIEFMGSAGTFDFQTAANWIGGHVPGAAQTPVIQGGNTVNMASSPSGTLTGLKVGQTGTGTLNISNATVAISSTWPNGLLVGQRAAANGAVVQSGNSSISVAGSSGFVSIGQYGTGSYTLQNGTFSATGDFNVGDCRGAHGYFYMQGGALNLATLYVGNGYYSSTTDSGISGNALGYVYQTGGTVTCTGSAIIGGRYNAYGIGSYQISAGTLSQSNSAVKLYIGQYGAGTLTVSGSGLVDSNGGIRLGGAASVTGEVFLNGGTIYTTLVDDGGGTSKFHFNGGTLKAKASATTFMQNLDTVDVQPGGAAIDTNGFNVTIGQGFWPLRPPAV